MQDTVAIHLGLKSITALCDRLGNPQDALKIIHVAGTNGKGSVSQMISASLQQAGYSVGVFTSPHLIDVEERIRINDQLISRADYKSYLERVEVQVQMLQKENIQISLFETFTALALLYFKENPVDFVILEVGLGGRLDATNVISHSVASIITKISIDHQDYLGNTLSAIATEKAGIIKEKGLVITAIQEISINDVIERKCTEKNATLIQMNPIDLQLEEVSEEGTSFSYREHKYRTQLIGAHQAYNASLAITALETLSIHNLIKITKSQIKEGIARAKWAGRFERIQANPLVFIDGAHNVDGMIALSHTLQKLPRRHTIGIFAVLQDKAVSEMLPLIHEQIDEWIVTEVDMPRALPKEKLAELLQPINENVYIAQSIEDAVDQARLKAHARDDVQIIGFGSLYMIGAIKQLF